MVPVRRRILAEDMSTKTLKLRWSATCAGCGTELPAGTRARWSTEDKAATCLTCVAGKPTEPAAPNPEPEPAEPSTGEPLRRGEAGASAAREHERRAQREAARARKAVEDDAAWRERARTERPVLGRIVTVFTPRPNADPEESQATAAWKTGQEGERRVAEILGACEAEDLHDRQIPRSRANIDHLAVGARGVFVIDAKKYAGRVERRDKGTLFRTDERLYVNGRDQSKLVDGVTKQCDVVRAALTDHFPEVDVQGVLCFVGAEWGFPPMTIRIGGVTCLWPRRLPKLVDGSGLLLADQREAIVRHLADALPEA